jgi:hypothetical protein
MSGYLHTPDSYNLCSMCQDKISFNCEKCQSYFFDHESKVKFNCKEGQICIFCKSDRICSKDHILCKSCSEDLKNEFIIKN